SRATSLTVFAGKLFASTGTCYRTMVEPPRPEEVRGKVCAFEAGANVSYDHDLGPGWKHLAAVRGRDRLDLYVNGHLTAAARDGKPPLDVSNGVPLRIGRGQQAHFCGKVRDVRLYDRALGKEEVQSLFGGQRSPEGPRK